MNGNNTREREKAIPATKQKPIFIEDEYKLVLKFKTQYKNTKSLSHWSFYLGDKLDKLTKFGDNMYYAHPIVRRPSFSFLQNDKLFMDNPDFKLLVIEKDGLFKAYPSSINKVMANANAAADAFVQRWADNISLMTENIKKS